MFSKLSKLIKPVQTKHTNVQQIKKCHNVFGIKELIHQEKVNFQISHITLKEHGTAVELIKRHYLPEHVYVREHEMNLDDDQALDEYLIGLLKQGNSIYARSEDGSVAGFCVNYASSPLDPRNLRNYAFYRQDPNTKDFLYFVAKMQETPNLWEALDQAKIFEIKMLAVLPKYRRQGLATLLTERSIELAYDQSYGVARMDCMNPHDYKIAERCMLTYVVKYPLHKLRGPKAQFIKRTSDNNVTARVYIAANIRDHRFWNNLEKLRNCELIID